MRTASIIPILRNQGRVTNRPEPLALSIQSEWGWVNEMNKFKKVKGSWTKIRVR